MSRGGNDDYDENFPNEWAFWERRMKLACTSKRGRKALAELREALLALPEKRLIEGAVCTVGAEARRGKWTAEGSKSWQEMDPKYRPADPWYEERDALDQVVRHDGEGVCAVGAYAWYRKVKAGVDPAAAFAELPDVAYTGEDALAETADLGKEAGLTRTLAWELAYRNDETYDRCTPEERYEKFLAWIDQELGDREASHA